MDWELKLISVYFWVCKAFDKGADAYCERFSNNTTVPEFTDEEAITVYLFGILRKYREVKDIHTYAKDHLSDWFPALCSYEKFNERLNHLNPVFAFLSELALSECQLPQWLINDLERMEGLVDSMPIIMAQGSRADKAKVATQIANKGYCSTKKLYYHGLKLHQLSFSNPQHLPVPQCLMFGYASENDNTFFKERIAPQFPNTIVYGDRIYHDRGAVQDLMDMYGIEVRAVQKRKKGQKELFYDQKLYSTAVSRVRQPVESFFGWLNEKTGIQCASKVRSIKGLLKHVFAKLTAALLLINIF